MIFFSRRELGTPVTPSGHLERIYKSKVRFKIMFEFLKMVAFKIKEALLVHSLAENNG